MDPQPSPHPPLEPLIRRSLHTATVHRARLQAVTLRLTVAALVLGALATFLAGLSSLTGAPLAADDWRTTCALASLLTLAATIAGGLQTIVARPDLTARASECVGKLRALLFEASAPDHDPLALRRKFQQVILDHAEIEL